jgi:hypothetical protein
MLGDDPKDGSGGGSAPPDGGGAGAASTEALLQQSRKNAEEKRQAKKALKEQQRLSLWRSRVNLIREARDRFSMKDYANSVSAYEKYFRVLEIIYEAKPNELKVSSFNNSARQKEMVVIVGAYWDMVRIYDMSPRFKNRLEQCAEKISEFLPFTPIYGEVLKKIEDYKKVAKNKDVFEKILKNAKKKSKIESVTLIKFWNFSA